MIRLLQNLRQHRWANYYILFTRFLIGYSFIPSGMVKVLGQPFTVLPTSNPVGYFFDAMYKTGIYWNFLGLTQVVAALLLMSQRFATLGALLFFGINLNIFLITFGIGFGNTTIITFLMLMACLSLVLWDFEKLLPLIRKDGEPNPTIEPDLLSARWTTTGTILAVIFTLNALVFYVFPHSDYTYGLVILIFPFVVALILAVRQFRSDARWVKRQQA